MTPPASACTVCQPTALEALVRSEPALAAQWQALPRRHFAASAVLLRSGETCTRAWLVESGLVRLYYLSDQGTERNRSFHMEGNWVGGGMPPLALPSPYTIEALEPVQAVELGYATLQDWHHRFPHIQALLNEAMGYLFTQHARRESDLLGLSPEARYRSFLADQGNLAERLPQHHVASYLGISAVSLSRIRARLGMVAAPATPRLKVPVATR
ncbi:MAG: hypothetical protein A3F76_08335 [Burkholderiales bacterium RIFCSPLOWO2_12_FULL_65_40]|nr:MAG: hypothetical protein A3F76_08335 [Burkholderiales bacterium RIFCSPLOWO2_12_FULL_65_40]